MVEEERQLALLATLARPGALLAQQHVRVREPTLVCGELPGERPRAHKELAGAGAILEREGTLDTGAVAGVAVHDFDDDGHTERLSDQTRLTEPFRIAECLACNVDRSRQIPGAERREGKVPSYGHAHCRFVCVYQGFL